MFFIGTMGILKQNIVLDFVLVEIETQKSINQGQVKSGVE